MQSRLQRGPKIISRESCCGRWKTDVTETQLALCSFEDLGSDWSTWILRSDVFIWAFLTRSSFFVPSETIAACLSVEIAISKSFHCQVSLQTLMALYVYEHNYHSSKQTVKKRTPGLQRHSSRKELQSKGTQQASATFPPVTTTSHHTDLLPPRWGQGRLLVRLASAQRHADACTNWPDRWGPHWFSTRDWGESFDVCSFVLRPDDVV
jgi:hypothetical protein